MARYSTAGGQLQRSVDGTTYVSVANCVNFSITGATKDEINATALSDTAQQFVDALPNFGSVQVSVAWDPADVGHQALFADFGTPNTSRYWKYQHPSSGTVGDMTWQGPVVGFAASKAPNSLDTHDFTIKISGSLAIATA